jgi:PadR family transcriptional regulator PadR
MEHFDITKFIENNAAQMRKGTLEMAILSIIRTNPVYAGDIIEKLRHTHLIVVEGTLYPLLSRMKRGGLLDYSWVESPTGPPRKYYRLTTEGRSVLERLVTEWKDMTGSIAKLIE